MKKMPLLAVTMGDPVGIGPEIIHKALDIPSIYKVCRPVVIGDPEVLKKAGEIVDSSLQVRILSSLNDGIFQPGTIDLLPVSYLDSDKFRPGFPDEVTGAAMVSYIDRAIELALGGAVSAVVTCPVNKVAMKLSGSEFHGHTELFASATKTEKYLMMMYGKRLSVVLVTIHIPLKDVKEALTTDKIFETIEITAESLRYRFGLSNPRIGVSGFNPHAGEDGLFGSEEEELISPAVQRAVEKGYDVKGPVPPDTVYYHASRGRYDVVVSMYHDQGLIPFKMIHFEDGVNTTLGLPIIRTSVDHGTAYDIAGKGKADAGSLVEAIKLAAMQAGFSEPEQKI